MAFHPPMLYLGLVGFTVPFAFAIAALATGRLGEGWLVETRPGHPPRVGLPHHRDHPRRLVELRGPRLGRLLGLGPRRERLAAPVAHRHGLPALGDGAGAPRDAARLEPVAPLRHVQPHDPRHVPHPLRGARVGARLQRQRHRRVAARRSSCSPWRSPSASSGGAGTGCARRARSTRRCRAKAPSSPTTCCSPASPSWCCSARCSRCWPRPSTIVPSRSGRRTSTG